MAAGRGFRENYAKVTDAIAANGGFSSDTFVDMPNAATTLVPASRWQTLLVDDTPGAEESEIQLSVLEAGAPRVAAHFKPGQLLVPSILSSTHPSYSFIDFPTAGMQAGNGIGGNGDVEFKANGETLLIVDWSLGIMSEGFGTPFVIGFDNPAKRGFGQNGSGGNVYLFGDKNFQIGAPGALDVAATAGYFLIPYSDGPPTGVPDPLPAGKAALHWDRTNKQIYIYDTAWRKTAALTP